MLIYPLKFFCVFSRMNYYSDAELQRLQLLYFLLHLMLLLLRYYSAQLVGLDKH